MRPLRAAPAALVMGALAASLLISSPPVAAQGTGSLPSAIDSMSTTSTTPSTSRLAGADRIGTAVAISQEAFPAPLGSSGAVYLARSDVLADAMVAGSLEDGPVLLVPSCSGVPSTVAAEIARLDPGRVVALGSTGAVCEATLAAAAGARSRDRLAGPDRYATSVAVARARLAQGSATEVYLASGQDSPDAVVGGQLTHGPILLVPSNDFPPQVVKDYLAGHSFRRVVALGGEGAVPPDTLVDLSGAIDRPRGRLAGTDRYGTAADIAYRQFPTDAETVYLARGDVLADGVASGALRDGPVVLVGSCTLPAPTRERIARVRPARIVALGGPGAVCDGVLAEAARVAAAPRSHLLLHDGTGWESDESMWPNAAALSADGTVAAWLTSTELHVMNLATGSRRSWSMPFTGRYAAPLPSLSSDGRKVAYSRYVDVGDSGEQLAVFVRDTYFGDEVVVSRRADGAVANGPSQGARISADGSTVVFSSAATDLDADQPGREGLSDVFAYDLGTKTITLVSRAPDGGPATKGASHAAVSADGSTVAYVYAASSSTGSGGEVEDAAAQVLVVDRRTGVVTVASVDSNESPMPLRYQSVNDGVLSVSEDGGRVGFVSGAGDTFSFMVRDLPSGTTRVASTLPGGARANARAGWVTADGRSAVFADGLRHFGGAAQAWYRVDLSTGEAVSLTLDHTGTPYSDTWLLGLSRDGRRALMSMPYGAGFSLEPAPGPRPHLWQMPAVP